MTSLHFSGEDWDFLSHVESRLQVRKVRLNETVDAEAKSLRRYGTTVFPPFRERLDYWFETGVRPYVVCSSSSFEWVQGIKDNFLPNSIMNYMLAPVYTYDEPGYCEVIEVNVSKDTYLVSGNSIREEVTEEFKQISRILNEVPSICDLAAKILGYKIVHDLLFDFRTSSLSTAIIDFLREHRFTFPADAFVLVPGRIVRPDLIMAVKYYPNRDDNRAYCRDLNILRATVGAALQRLILPKSMKVKSELQYCRIVPPKGKDSINITVTPAPEYVHLVLISDISNFTGSSANAWLMLYCMALDLAHGKIQDKDENLFCINGEHFVASALEIIVLYLYLTVGYPCSSEKTSTYHWLPGGFLGVGANICVALLFYSTLLEWLKRNSPEFVKYMKSQAGGDDVIMVLKLKRKDAVPGELWIRDELTNYVGYVKEMRSFILEDQDDGIVPGMPFCRKRTVVSRDGKYLKIRSEESLPLNEALTAPIARSRPQKQQDLWNTVHRELRMYETRNIGKEWVTDAVRVLILDRLPLATPSRTISIYMESDLEIVAEGRHLATPRAVILAQLVTPMFHLKNVYYGTIEQCLQYLVRRGVLKKQLVRCNGLLNLVVMTDKEAKRYRGAYRMRYNMIVVVCADMEVVQFLK